MAALAEPPGPASPMKPQPGPSPSPEPTGVAIGDVADAGAALYVANLAESVAEELLGSLFSQVAPVLSVHVCRAVDGFTSLGYGFVNFQSREDASRALETLNFAPLNGKRIRVMFSNKDPAIRKSGRANVFIKNLERNIDNMGLYEMFCSFGTILSCKVATDFDGQSKGHGFVQFKTEESAKESINQLNGMLINGKKIFVGLFMCREERERIVGPSKFTNVYVKNLPEEFTDDDLRHEFEPFGDITSAVVMKDTAGKSRSFGFVNFKNPESASAAIENMNGLSIKDMVLFVGKAQKRAERLAELKEKKLGNGNNGKLEKLQGFNLYLKNLDDSISDVQHLRKLFEGFGEIGSCKVMLDSHGRSKGSGFVSFTSVEAAHNAIYGMNGKIVGSKPLYVAVAQRKEERKAMLTAYFDGISRPGAMTPTVPVPPSIAPHPFNFGQAVPGLFPPQAPGFGYHQHFVPGMRPGAHDMMPPFSMTPMHPGQRMGALPGEMHHQMFHPNARQSFSYMPNVNYPPMLHPSFSSPMLPSQLDVYDVEQRDAALGVPVSISRRSSSSSLPATPATIPSSSSSDNLPADPASVPSRRSRSSSLPTTLASADPEVQRSILVNNLYPLVQQYEPENAGRVTRMLLELDKSEVLNLIESAGDLRDKVGEAMDALRQQVAPSSSTA